MAGGLPSCQRSRRQPTQSSSTLGQRPTWEVWVFRMHRPEGNSQYHHIDTHPMCRKQRYLSKYVLKILIDRVHKNLRILSLKNMGQDPPSEAEMRCLTRPGRVALVSSRTLGHFFVSSPLCSGRGGFIPCKHLDLLVRWSDLYVTSVKMQETHRNRSHFYETLYIFYIFCYPSYHVLPFQRWANEENEEILLRRFFPSKVGGRPAWLGDSSSVMGCSILMFDQRLELKMIL